MLTISCALLHTGCKYDEFRSATEPCGQNVDWTFDFETGALTITGDGPMETCPWQTTHRDLIKSVIVSEGITSIVDTAFVGCGNITSVTWNAKNCTTVDRSVFGRDSLIETFVFGDKVEVIPTRLCANLKKVTEIIIPNSVKTIGYRAFYNSGLTKVVIGNNVTTIGVRAFQSCYALNDITIPNSVTIIGDTAFSNCTQLKKVTIGDGVREIGQCAFKSCSGLENVTFGSNVTIIKLNAFGLCSRLKSITIPGNVWTIEEKAFQDCGLTSVIIGAGVDRVTHTSIGKMAFRDCYYLSSVTIDKSVHSIDSTAFYDCPNITSVVWNARACLQGYYFGSQIESFVFGDDVTLIPAGLCKNMTKLTTITIPKNVVDIGTQLIMVNEPLGVMPYHYETIYPFDGCDNITSVVWNAKNCKCCKFGSQVESFVFGNEVEVIPAGICSGMEKLTSIIIPNSVTTIGSGAFQGCTGLTSFVLPNNVTKIDGYTFDNCTGLTSPIYNAHVFAFMPRSYSGSYTIPNGIETIAPYAFDRCIDLTSITIPNSVTGIGGYAFRMCTGLTSVTIPNSVTNIGESAFSNCTSLTSVTIPNSVTSIGKYACNGCSSLTSVTIPSSITYIGSGAFAYCSGLTSVTCLATTPPELENTGGPNTFSRNDHDRIQYLYVPAESVSVYSDVSDWKRCFKNILPISE